MADPKYTFNTGDKTASLDIYVGSNLETTYSYDNGIITLSERLNDANVNIGNLTGNILQIKNWINLINQFMNPPAFKRGLYEEDVQKKNNKLEGKFEADNSKVSDVTFDPMTGISTFKARAEIQLNFLCFNSWYNFLERFLKDASNF